LESIKGIGKQTADHLLKTFRSVRNIKAATESELSAVIGSAKAKIVCAFFSNQREEETQAG
jgi:excinuclease ABC subunit C